MAKHATVGKVHERFHLGFMSRNAVISLMRIGGK